MVHFYVVSSLYFFFFKYVLQSLRSQGNSHLTTRVMAVNLQIS